MMVMAMQESDTMLKAAEGELKDRILRKDLTSALLARS